MEPWTTRGDPLWDGTMCTGESLSWRTLNWVLPLFWISGRMEARLSPSGNFVEWSKSWGNIRNMTVLLRLGIKKWFFLFVFLWFGCVMDWWGLFCYVFSFGWCKYMIEFVVLFCFCIFDTRYRYKIHLTFLEKLRV